MGTNQTFKSVDQIVKAYWPKEFQERSKPPSTDPGTAGEELGRRVVESLGKKLAASMKKEK